jgi:hypothetical protein
MERPIVRNVAYLGFVTLIAAVSWSEHATALGATDDTSAALMTAVDAQPPCGAWACIVPAECQYFEEEDCDSLCATFNGEGSPYWTGDGWIYSQESPVCSSQQGPCSSNEVVYTCTCAPDEPSPVE